MLYRLTQEQLSKTLMPLGGYSKREVRETAEKARIKVASKPDSQEICFVLDGDYAGFIEKHADNILGTGNFVDEQGNILGKHKGIIHYTVGQRKKLGIALGKPAHIKKICADNNDIVLSTSDDIGCFAIVCKDLNFTGIEEPAVGDKLRFHVKVRYRHPGMTATCEMTAPDCMRITFDAPVHLAAPGQSAVFYGENDCLIGGGIISEVIFDE
jgi:tRNA-specific 2-thiouridylase